MKSVNKATLLGNLGHSPDTKYTQSQMAICKTTLATSRKKKDGDGNWVEETTWHNLVFFDKSAEIVQEYVKKGDAIYIEGWINNTSYTGKDGNKKYRSEVVVNDFTMLGRRTQPQTASQAPQEPQAARQASQDLAKELRSTGIPAEPSFDDDIPF